VDARDIGERSDAVLRTAMRGHDESSRSDAAVLPRLAGLLHVLDVGEHDAFGALAGVAEIELILGEKHRIAVDVVSDTGVVSGDEGVKLLRIVG